MASRSPADASAVYRLYADTLDDLAVLRNVVALSQFARPHTMPPFRRMRRAREHRRPVFVPVQRPASEGVPAVPRPRRRT